MTEIGPESPLKAKPARGFALVFGLGFGLILLIVMAFVLPVEWSDAKLRFRLWRAGARAVVWEKHRGFTLDRCGGKPPTECPCVWLVHGLGDSVTTWRKLFLEKEAFGTQSLRIFAIDLPGHGGSLRRRDPKEYRVATTARELADEISKTSTCEKNNLIGNSFGGWIAAEMALQFPERFASLILISPSGVAAAESATADLRKVASVESLKEFQRRAYFAPRELTDDQWAKALKRQEGNATAEIRGAQVPEDRLDGRLGGIKIPSTLIWGEADRITPNEVISVFTREMKDADFDVIPQCGHLPQKECPEKLYPHLQRALFGSAR